MKQKKKSIFIVLIICGVTFISSYSLWSDNQNVNTYLPSKNYYHTEIENIL